MATSRTGTSTWKNLRTKVLRRARAAGLTNCPICGIWLDYDTGRTPASAEVDHIVPSSHGGKDVEENCRVICRRDNQSRGNRPTPKAATKPATLTPFVNPRW
ncbi:HNH endonuclease [Zafaria sp. Z1313]|uniref:HNH endonuclease n=1 Tax=Zafaria sp. Z1313 TaxID=3423202 RepID=UPI003D302AB6